MSSFIFYLKQIKRRKTPFGEIFNFLKWKKSLSPGSSSVIDEQPWITYKVISFLQTHLKPKATVFEYGGGGSTLFFINNGAKVYTVEHNAEWFTTLQNILLKKGTLNWEGHLLEAQVGNYVESPQIADPNHYASDDENYKNQNFYNYASKIDGFPDSFFDFVVVDGRSRPACFKHSIPKLKSGGYMILDNADREYYLTYFTNVLLEKFEVIIDSYGASPYSELFTKTSVWKKK